MWKDIIGYKGYYQLSNKGEVKSLKRVIIRKDNKPYTTKELIMKLSVRPNGYIMVRLTNKYKKSNWKLVHRLVAETFIEKKEYQNVVNHKNGIKSDNSVENLEWTTILENNRHAFRMGLKKGKKGIEHNYCKLTEQQVFDIVKKYSDGKTYKNIAIQYNISETAVFDILTGASWQHLNFNRKVKRKTKRLNENQVIEIILNGKYDTYKNIGIKYEVDEETIRNILTRNSWLHIHKKLENCNDYSIGCEIQQ